MYIIYILSVSPELGEPRLYFKQVLFYRGKALPRLHP